MKDLERNAVMQEMGLEDMRETNGGAEYIQPLWSGTNNRLCYAMEAAANACIYLANGCIWIYNQC